MSNLRDVLEIESSNMSEAVSRLDAAIKGECAIDDADLVRMKNTFTEGLEYLRNFQPDADELFNRKLRFSAGDDAAKLPAAIATSGELCVLVPQFSGRYLPLEQSYLPRPFRLPLESDNYRVKADERASMRERENDRTSSRHSHRNPEPDESSIRYRRRQQLEEEAWNRLRNSSAAPSLLTTSTIADSSSSRTSPWAADRISRSVEPSKSRPTSLIVPNTETPRTVSPASKPPLPPPSSETTRRDEEPAPLPQIPMRKPPLPRQQSSNDDSLNEKVETIRRAHQQRQAASRAVSSEESEGEDFPVTPNRGRIRIVCRAASVNRDDGLMTMIPGTGLIQNAPLLQSLASAPLTAPLPSSNPITTTTNTATGEQVAIPVTHFTGEEDESDIVVPAWLQRRRQRFQRSRTNPDLQAQFTSARVQQLLAERQSRLDSSTTTDEEKEKLAVMRQRGRSASREAGEWRARGRPRAVFGRKGAKDGELNWPRGICALSGGLVATCDSSNHRVCVFDKDGKFVRQFGGYGSGNGQLDSAAGLASSKLRIVVSDRYNHRISVFE
uniref:RING-type domain-containing protein n=1 Tax=Caenorhabditis tropicalis TaxID=1561998 RepID=A0A1I7USN0_9PELO